MEFREGCFEESVEEGLEEGFEGAARDLAGRVLSISSEDCVRSSEFVRRNLPVPRRGLVPYSVPHAAVARSDPTAPLVRD